MAEYDDWFNNTFGGSGASSDMGGGYSGENYDQMFQQTFGDVPGTSSVEDTTGQGAAPTGAASASFTGGSFSGDVSGAIDNALGYAKTAISSLGDWASKVFTEQPSTTTRYNPATGKYEDVANAGGGLNSLGKTLLAGALQSLGTAAVAKWQNERASEEAAKGRKFSAAEKEKDRQFERDKIADQNARKPYGTDTGLGVPRTGVGLINRGTV